MAEHKIERMTVAEFLAWEPADDQRYELVDGIPVAMTGARRVHDEVVVTILGALLARLRGGPCRPYTDDLAIQTKRNTVRRPDVTVDCGPRGRGDLLATGPVLIVEVLSDSTRRLDKHLKAIEYKALTTVRHILIVDPDDASAILHGRDRDGGWTERALIGRETAIELPAIGITLPMSEIYDDVVEAEA